LMLISSETDHSKAAASIGSEIPETILTESGTQSVLRRAYGGNVIIRSEKEVLRRNGARANSGSASVMGVFGLGSDRSGLGNLPVNEADLPATTWFKNLLTEGIQPLALSDSVLRQPSRPARGRRILGDGSNLPWAVEDLRERAPQQFQDWIALLRTVLPDLVD